MASELELAAEIERLAEEARRSSGARAEVTALFLRNAPTIVAALRAASRVERVEATCDRMTTVAAFAEDVRDLQRDVLSASLSGNPRRADEIVAAFDQAWERMSAAIDAVNAAVENPLLREARRRALDPAPDTKDHDNAD